MPENVEVQASETDVRRSWNDVERAERRLLAQIKQQWLCELLEFQSDNDSSMEPIVVLAPAG
ncbi:MAG: hypothetical protein AAF483_07750 [Planctomycetota bacterium]